MHVSNSLHLIALVFCLTSFAAPKRDTGSTGNAATTQAADSLPEIEVVLALKDTALHYGDSIYLNISLKNKSHNVQKLLFDRPSISTGGPWAMTGRVTDVQTKQSVLQYENKAILSSQLYTEAELKDEYYYLQHGQSIQRQYALSDLVVFNAPDHRLPKGIYEVQLFYHSHPSNIVKIKIE